MATAAKQKYEGIICPRLLDKYSYLSVPQTEEQCYELTWDDFRQMSGKLSDKPLCAMHGSIPVGKITRNWATGDGQWKVEFEVDTTTLAGYDMSKQVEAGTLNSLSLKHHHGEKEPYEVSLVFEPARDGSVILRDGAKKTESYKDATQASVQGWSRETVIKAAKGSMTHVRLNDPREDQKKASDFTIVQGGASLAALQTAEALIAREQQAAQQAAKQAQEAREAIEVAKRRELNAQQHKQLDAARKSDPMQAENIQLPQQIPPVGEQMRGQVESQVAAASKDSMSLAMQEDDDEPAKQAPQKTPQRITGDAAVDAILADPSVPAAHKERLIASMEKRREEETKLRQEAEAAKAQFEQEKQQFRQNYVETNLAFQKMIMGKVDPKAAQDLADRAAKGQLDEHIMSPAGRAEVAAQKKAVKQARKTQQTDHQMSQELLARARALDQSLGGGRAPGVAHSASSFGDPRSVVAAGRRHPALYEDADDEGDKGMGLGIPREFRKSDPQVIAAGRQTSGTGFGHASGNGADPFAPWNVRLEDAYRRGAISQMAARQLLVPEQLPKSHPVVISAAKGGIGADLKSSAVDEKGADESWCAGLTKDYFHPDALKLLIGDGKEVPHEFELYPETRGTDGEDLGGAFPGTTSSFKRRKQTSV